MMNNLIQVKSSNINAVGYNNQYKILTIEFQNGNIYNYQEVPKTVYDELMDADSKGKYFMKNIRFKFAYEKLDQKGGE